MTLINAPDAATLLLQREGTVMRIRQQRQLNPIDDEVLALTAVVRPILSGVLYGLKIDIAAEAGGYSNIKLKMLPAFTALATAT